MESKSTPRKFQQRRYTTVFFDKDSIAHFHCDPNNEGSNLFTEMRDFKSTTSGYTTLDTRARTDCSTAKRPHTIDDLTDNVNYNFGERKPKASKDGARHYKATPHGALENSVGSTSRNRPKRASRPWSWLDTDHAEITTMRVRLKVRMKAPHGDPNNQSSRRPETPLNNKDDNTTARVLRHSLPAFQS